MPRTRRVDCFAPGIARRRHGRGFAYFEAGGERVRDRATIDRIRSLAIPPAARGLDLPRPARHIQATGVDDAGRKQYRYHDDRRARPVAAKFDAMIAFARSSRCSSGVEEADRSCWPTSATDAGSTCAPRTSTPT